MTSLSNILAPLFVGLFCQMALANISIGNIQYDHCVKDQCISFRAKQGASTFDANHYLIKNPRFVLQNVNLDFLEQSRAKKAIIDVKSNLVRIYSLEYQESEYDVAIDLDNFSVTRFIRH